MQHNVIMVYVAVPLSKNSNMCDVVSERTGICVDEVESPLLIMKVLNLSVTLHCVQLK